MDDANIWLLVGGGAGDVFQTYMSEIGGDMPSNDPFTGSWFRRLASIKQHFPNIKICVVSVATNTAANDLFEHHPYIDEFHYFGSDYAWDLPALFMKVKQQLNAVYPNSIFALESFDREPPKIYLLEDDEEKISSIINLGPYIIMHPFGGHIKRWAIDTEKYFEIAMLINKLGFNVVVVGKSVPRHYDKSGVVVNEEFNFSSDGIINLVNNVNYRVALSLVEHSVGFIGSHSNIVLAAWYWNKQNVCIVPVIHELGQSIMDFFNSNNPTAWAANAPFTKIVIAENGNVDICNIVDWFGRNI